MRLSLVAMVVAFALAGCAVPVQHAAGPYTPYDRDTAYRVEDRDGGFTITVTYAQRQFRGDSLAMFLTCTRALTAVAHDVAERRGREIQEINHDRIKVSVGRNSLTGTSLCSATAPAEFADRDRASTSRGTAFAVASEGLLLTAFHVVEDAKTITVTCPGRAPAPATVWRNARKNDLAVLQAPLGRLPYLSVAPSRSLRVGDPVFTVGFPATAILGTEPKFSDGSVSALTGTHDDSTLVQVTVPVQGGNSGGALLNQRGEVVGVITSSAAEQPFAAATGRRPQNVNWAVKSEYALLLLDELPAPSAAATREDAIDQALGATYRVEATR